MKLSHRKEIIYAYSGLGETFEILKFKMNLDENSMSQTNSVSLFPYLLVCLSLLGIPYYLTRNKLYENKMSHLLKLNVNPRNKNIFLMFKYGKTLLVFASSPRFPVLHVAVSLFPQYLTREKLSLKIIFHFSNH
jgi:hypothetical protein